MPTTALSCLALLAALAGAELRAQSASTVAADHHMHILSPAGATALAELDAVQNAGPRAPKAAADAIEALDAAGVGRGLILSNAYMFGAPDLEPEDKYAKVRAENDYVAAEVARYPDRLVGAFSLNPLADYALEEIERCAADARLGAIKLHLTNSDVDLRNAQHVARLADVFRELGRREIPVVVHMRTGDSGYGARDARIFIDEVLSQAPELPVQIAHMAGWGGYDDATDAALGAFARAFDEERLERGLYTFGLGAVVFLPAAAGDDEALQRRTEEANRKLAARIRQIGVEQVVYATDWPSWPPVADASTGISRNLRLIDAALPVTEEERLRIFANTGAVFDHKR